MKKKYQYFSFIFPLLCFLQNTHTYCQYQSKGLVKTSEYIPTRIIGNRILDKDSLLKKETNIWFFDSTVIYEFRINLKSENQTSEGWVVKESYPVQSYIYLDLRTMICQEYLSFKDTAKPFCTYRFGPSDYMVWRFFDQKGKDDTISGTIPMKDTSINNKIYKRIKVLYKYYSIEKNYIIFYIDCAAKKNIFHGMRMLEEMYPGCTATFNEFYDENGGLMQRSGYEITRGSLSNEEECIFRSWTKNAANNKLPLITQDKARKIILPYPEHENPIITILPLEKR
jgi:hypothetical protein